ncbi:hypothetical protein Tco_1237123 [Tanacetum coccineum]
MIQSRLQAPVRIVITENELSSKEELEHLFGPMFNEYVMRPALAVSNISDAPDNLSLNDTTLHTSTIVVAEAPL